ncbi:MAG: ABC-type phosphate transport system, substrate-binding protein [Lacunisphaera sp.]|nr:ABC-type phosphate transport system, substrate-binding protein [Lacunisphaera sp.]
MKRIAALLLFAGAFSLRAAGPLDAALPGYKAEQTVGGGLNSVGDDALEPLMTAWLAAFQKYQPGVVRGERWSHPGGAAAFSALMLEVTDVAPLGREPWPAELAPYGHQFKGDMMTAPVLIRVGTGSFRPAGRSGALAIHVNAANPLKQLSLAQLDAIFGAQRKRGAAAALLTWGQLGLTGEWADRPIVPVATPDYSTPAQVFQNRVLQGGLWTANLEVAPAPAAALQKVAAIPGAIAFAGFMDASQTKTLALAETEAGPFVTASDATVADHSYPLTRDLYLAVNQRPGAPLPQKTKEFLSFVLSREGQAIVAACQYFFALNAADAARERARLTGYLAPVDPAIPSYHAASQVSGPIANVGSDGMESLVEKWMRAFCALQPGVHRGERWSHQGTLNGYQALLAGETDLAPMGRELWPGEKVIYQAVRGQPEPLEIRVARGGFNTPQRTTAQAIFVNERNPLTGLTVAQVDAIFGRERRQGSPAAITRWGQLGLTGEWTERPITIYVPNRITPNAMSVQISVLKGGPWSAAMHEASVADVAAAVAREPGAIAFGGFEDGGPGLKPVAIAAQAGGEFISGNAADVATGRYPLTRYMYIRLNREPGQPLKPQVREFLRFILSREGQEFIPTSAYYPLRADEVAEELAKLD